MVGAAEVLHPARAGAQLRAAMEAGVVERADLVGRGADDDERPVGDLVDDRVADLGDLLLAARHLPGAAPDVLDLEPVELRVEVAGRRELHRLGEAGRGRAEAGGHRPGLLVEQPLGRSARRGRPRPRRRAVGRCLSWSPSGLRVGEQHLLEGPIDDLDTQAARSTGSTRTSATPRRSWRRSRGARHRVHEAWRRPRRRRRPTSRGGARGPAAAPSRACPRSTGPARRDAGPRRRARRPSARSAHRRR